MMTLGPGSTMLKSRPSIWSKESESETSQGDQGIQKRETCQFCLFTKTNCKCKAELEEQKEVNSNSKMKVDKRSKNQPIKIKINLAKNATSSNVDTVEEAEVIESVKESNLVCPQNREGFWVVFDKCLLDTVNAGLCFSFTHDGQVSLDFFYCYLCSEPCTELESVNFQVDVLCKTSDGTNVSKHPRISHSFQIGTNQAIFVPLKD